MCKDSWILGIWRAKVKCFFEGNKAHELLTRLDESAKMQDFQLGLKTSSLKNRKNEFVSFLGGNTMRKFLVMALLVMWCGVSLGGEYVGYYDAQGKVRSKKVAPYKFNLRKDKLKLIALPNGKVTTVKMLESAPTATVAPRIKSVVRPRIRKNVYQTHQPVSEGWRSYPKAEFGYSGYWNGDPRKVFYRGSASKNSIGKLKKSLREYKKDLAELEEKYAGKRKNYRYEEKRNNLLMVPVFGNYHLKKIEKQGKNGLGGIVIKRPPIMRMSLPGHSKVFIDGVEVADFYHAPMGECWASYLSVTLSDPDTNYLPQFRKDGRWKDEKFYFTSDQIQGRPIIMKSGGKDDKMIIRLKNGDSIVFTTERSIHDSGNQHGGGNSSSAGGTGAGGGASGGSAGGSSGSCGGSGTGSSGGSTGSGGGAGGSGGSSGWVLPEKNVEPREGFCMQQRQPRRVSVGLTPDKKGGMVFFTFPFPT